ncbi:GNAT family N-acetyltransferase [Sphingomonas sp.]|uniref:GNAT family N-acetyltransferase n=1 Tax=Sphingomonas sp. TaxID=28214 RepID=UPI003D6D7BD0
MTDFSRTILTYWNELFTTGDVIRDDSSLSITLNPALSRERRVMLLEIAGGQARAVLTPALARKAGLERGQDMSVSGFRQRLMEAGVVLHGADCVFYFPELIDQRILTEPSTAPRRLTEHDHDAFAAFQSAASEQDLEDAYVELDHWAVFGAFDQDRLASVASIYPWDNAPIADLGVLTLPEFRGRGYARTVVRSISQFARDQGYEPQYRCQLDNAASIRLAGASGLMLFGKWDVISPDSPDCDAA